MLNYLNYFLLPGIGLCVAVILCFKLRIFGITKLEELDTRLDMVNHMNDRRSKYSVTELLKFCEAANISNNIFTRTRKFDINLLQDNLVKIVRGIVDGRCNTIDKNFNKFEFIKIDLDRQLFEIYGSYNQQLVSDSYGISLVTTIQFSEVMYDCEDRVINHFEKVYAQSSNAAFLNLVNTVQKEIDKNKSIQDIPPLPPPSYSGSSLDYWKSIGYNPENHSFKEILLNMSEIKND